MPKNKGFRYERDLVNLFDQAKAEDLPKEKRYIMREVFGSLDDNHPIHCDLVDGVQKPDLYIEYKGERKYISVKCGKLASVHQEKISTFIEFLRSIGFSEEMINLFKLFFYRDGTLDGTGKESFQIEEFIKMYPKEAEDFNNYVNSNNDFLLKTMERFMFKGSNPNNIEADYIYFPNAEREVILSKRQIRRYVSYKRWRFMNNPHFGPFQFRPHIKNPSNEWKTRYKHRMDVWWSTLSRDIFYIYDYYKNTN